jgi:hypothetical protein
MHWVRRWRYELRWEPGHRGGVLSRHVDTLAHLKAVVQWARANPHVIKCSYRPVYDLEGTPATTCSHGHRLESPDPRQPWRWRQDTHQWKCRACPGHAVTICPK